MRFNEEYQINQKFADLFKFDSDKEEIKHDALMLMASYLSEIERIQSELKVNRKELAQKINTSPSYLTQVFRGDKPLNFETLAKIQRALEIKFDVTIKHPNRITTPIPTTLPNRLFNYLSVASLNHATTPEEGQYFQTYKAESLNQTLIKQPA